ncbi:hypothetical protein ARD30_18690 [Bosea thiooxidans]|uniref:Uncharacterized protein n=1 Tax=Bosea thiooxidans TaxID=53254 RepID=A0A0Q3PHN1_9HYPH|nr:hypothetical protein [Bosea thiooxidans]KQK29262.1 hypothetical protein ARD30_18690 [Bosea thiooxidans]SKB39521.1 hypothetical protein SAMN05660750_00546 [Bosea thiooxidans]
MIEAAMLFALGFLCAGLLALAAVPALSRRADRLARKRAEAAFPLSLAEIAADRDHLRAELALRMRATEQEAERGFAAKAGAMQELGRRDMTIGRLERESAERSARIATLEDELAATRRDRDETRTSLEQERAGHGETAATLDKRLADLASLEQNLAETRQALSGTGADLSARNDELGRERETVGRIEALLVEREQELATLRSEHERLRVAQVEDRTQIMILQAKRDELAGRLAASEERLAELDAGLKKMTAERDGERVRAGAFDARAAQAEAGLAAADARAGTAAVAAGQLEARLLQAQADHAAVQDKAQSLEQALAAAQAELAELRRANKEEIVVLQNAQRERESQVEMLRAELRTLEGALSQAREDRDQLLDEMSGLRRAAAGAGGSNAALRQEITRLADRLMSLAPSREAAE